VGDEKEPPPKEGQLSLDERKFIFEQQKFEYENAKSRGLGFVNNNLGIIITAIIGAATIMVSYLQLQISNRSSRAQLELQSKISDAQVAVEHAKAKADKDKDDRTFQFDVARMLLEKQGDINTDDVKHIVYMRDIVMNTLPAEVAIKITRKMADNAPNDLIRSAWNDSNVSLQLSVSVSSTPSLQSFSITVDYVVAKIRDMANDDARTRIADLLAAAHEFKIEDGQATSVFLAYIFYTSANFKQLEENLNYNSASRIADTFSARFRDSDPAEFVGKPQLLANKVYGYRMGNSDPDDGWKFRGRGYLMTAGKEAYIASSALVGIDLVANPEALVGSKVAAREAAARFARIKDQGSVSSVLRALNGGYSGISQVQAIFETLATGAPKVTEGLAIKPVTADGSGPRAAR
jgi:putative chitinase